MSKKLWLLVGLLLLTACTTTTPTAIEPTVVSPSQTMQVPKTPFPTLTATQKVIRPTSTPIPSELVEMDPAYFEGIIVITQYYTYLDKGLFIEAFSLLSSKEQRRQSMEEYVKMATLAFNMVEIKTIQPYYFFAQQHSWKTTPEKGDIRQFFVEIIAEGEGGMSGSYPNGVVQSLFISLIQENSAWKINNFGK